MNDFTIRTLVPSRDVLALRAEITRRGGRIRKMKRTGGTLDFMIQADESPAAFFYGVQLGLPTVSKCLMTG